MRQAGFGDDGGAAAHLSGILQMNPEPAWIFALFPLSGQARLAARTTAVIQAPRTAAEWLIWLFSLASGRTPPIGSCLNT